MYLDNYFKIHVCLSFCPFVYFVLFVTLQPFITVKGSEASLEHSGRDKAKLCIIYFKTTTIK